jgi:hypothetical protein
MWGYGYGFDWLSMILMSLGMVFWIALLVVLVWAISAGSRGERALRHLP